MDSTSEPKPGVRSTKFWITLGVVISMPFLATVLLAVDLIKADHWVSVVTWLSVGLPSVYTLGRQGVKALGRK